MKKTNIEQVRPINDRVYHLGRVFTAAAADRDQYELDLESARAIKSEHGIAQYSALLQSAKEVVDMLEQYRLCGMTHIETAFPLDSEEKDGNCFLANQLRNGQVKGFKRPQP